MRRVLVYLGAALFPIALVESCSSDDPPAASPDASDEFVGQPSICDPDKFSGNGNACSPVSNQRCFAECDNGGCTCKANPSGTGGIWACVTDTSCYPDGAPFGDTGGQDVQNDTSDSGADQDAPDDADDSG